MSKDTLTKKRLINFELIKINISLQKLIHVR